MEENKKRRTGRYPKNNKRTHCVMVRFDDVEWARFLTLYEQSGVYAKAVFVKSRVFGETFKVVKVDKTMVDFYEKLSSFHAQFRGVAVNYNQVVKELRSHFSEKKAMALLYRLESYWTQIRFSTTVMVRSMLHRCWQISRSGCQDRCGWRSLSSISHSIPILTIS